MMNASAQTGANIQARDENRKRKLIGANESAAESENPEPNTGRLELISEENRRLGKRARLFKGEVAQALSPELHPRLLYQGITCYAAGCSEIP
jgi:hypothetical protein